MTKEVGERQARFRSRRWDEADWRELSPRAQWFYMLLQSQADLSWAGVIGLTERRWTRMAAGSTIEQVHSAITELDRTRFVVVDEDTEELLLRRYIHDDEVYKQPNVLKSALKSALGVHSQRIRLALAAELRLLDMPEADKVAAVLEVTSKGSPDPSPKGSGKGSANPSPKGSGNPSPKGSGAPRAVREEPQVMVFDEGFREGFGEGFADPFTEGLPEPSGEGEGEGEQLSVDINSSSETSSSGIASRPAPPRPDVDQLCAALHDLIVANGSKASVGEKWRTDARLLLDRDRRPLAEALDLIRWSQADPFWRGNVLSMPTFRKQYDKLRLARDRNGLRAVSGGYTPWQNPTDQSGYDAPIR